MPKFKWDQLDKYDPSTYMSVKPRVPQINTQVDLLKTLNNPAPQFWY
jgi:hypothetical protein